MLTINLEFIRGMLFVRLRGKLDHETCKKFESCLDDMLNNKGLKYFVINIEELNYIDDNGINTIMNKYSDVIKKNGKLIICGYNIDIKLNEIEHTNNELNALKLISI